MGNTSEYAWNVQGMCNSMNKNPHLSHTWVLLTWVDPGLMLSSNLGSSWYMAEVVIPVLPLLPNLLGITFYRTCWSNQNLKIATYN